VPSIGEKLLRLFGKLLMIMMRGPGGNYPTPLRGLNHVLRDPNPANLLIRGDRSLDSASKEPHNLTNRRDLLWSVRLEAYPTPSLISSHE
jgi:hypothetical protein